MAGLLSIVGASFVFSISIPLIFFAALTTLLAIGVLFLRVFVVYLELILALLRSWADSSSSGYRNGNAAGIAPPKLAQRVQAPARHRRKSFMSSKTSKLRNFRPASDVFETASRFGGNNLARDFEGVGGWGSQNEENSAAWTNINARLDIAPSKLEHKPIKPVTPTGTRSGAAGSARLRSSQGQPPQIPENLRISPLETRSNWRTPPATAGIAEGSAADGYFSIPVNSRIMTPGEVSSRIRMDERRAGVNSVHSSGSSGRRMSGSSNS